MVCVPVALWALAVGAGCVQYTKPVAPEAPMTPQQRNYDACWRASLDVLREFYFTIDVRDYRGGEIKTHPMVGQYFFEFWRHDAVRFMDLMEGSIQKVFRTATVHIRPTAPGARTYEVSCEVTTTRSDRYRAGEGGTTDAYDMFVLPGGPVTDENLLTETDTMDETARLERRRGLVNLGPDQGLADRLTDRINARARKYLEGEGK